MYGFEPGSSYEALIMEAVSTFEPPVYFHETTQHNLPEDSSSYQEEGSFCEVMVC
jgi:hypothetical protein